MKRLREVGSPMGHSLVIPLSIPAGRAAAKLYADAIGGKEKDAIYKELAKYAESV